MMNDSGGLGKLTFSCWKVGAILVVESQRKLASKPARYGVHSTLVSDSEWVFFACEWGNNRP
jgi:hypothetical protein